MEAALDFRLLDLIATVIEGCERQRSRGPGHPPAETVRVLATLRQFLREGTPWRGLRATEGKASGSTLRRCLERWARDGVLAQVHAMLVAMLRGDPTLILDSCSVRAKRAGDLTGPNPTDHGKRGTKYHVAVTGDGVPVACIATPANVNDTLVFERLFLAAFAVMARIRTVFSGKCPKGFAEDKGYDAEPHRDLCRSFGAEPCIHKRGRPRGAGLGQKRWRRRQASLAPRWSAAMPGCWRTNVSRCATTGSASSCSPCSKPHAYSWLQESSPANSDNRLLNSWVSRS